MNKTDLSNIEKSISKVGTSVNKTIASVGRWALAIFGVRTAYNFVRQSASTLAQYNEQIASDFEYIRFALASALQPVIEGIIQLVYKLLTYVNYIAQAWFGVNLFANASAKSMDKSAKTAEKMKKSLTGFDEMNVVGGGQSGGASGGTPSFDLSGPQDLPVPTWLQWIIDNKDVVLATLTGFATALTLINFGVGALMGFGIGVIVAGVVLLIQDIIAMIQDPSWQNFVNILADVAIVIGGIMLVMGNWWGLLVIIIAAIVKLVVDNWETIKGVLAIVGSWIYENIITPVWNFIKALFDTIVTFIKNQISVWKGIFVAVIEIIKNPFVVAYETVKNVFNSIKTIIKGVFDVISGLFTGDWKRVMEGFKNIFKGVFDTLWSIAKAPLNLIIGGINALIKGANKISFDVPDWVPGLGGKKFGFNIPEIPKLAVGGIINMPGRGVPIGSAIGGEAGAEGVIPLTNSQAMETLGEAIGRYITVNANITNTMNGRVISRELKKISANSDFALNR